MSGLHVNENESLYERLSQKRIQLVVFNELKNRINEGKSIDENQLCEAVKKRIVDNQSSVIPEDKEIKQHIENIKKQVGEFNWENENAHKEVKRKYTEAADLYNLIDALIELRSSYLKKNKDINLETINKLVTQSFLILDGEGESSEKINNILKKMDKAFEKEKDHYLSVPWNRDKKAQDFETMTLDQNSKSYQFAKGLRAIQQFRNYQLDNKGKKIVSLIEEIKKNEFTDENVNILQTNKVNVDDLKKYMELQFKSNINTSDTSLFKMHVSTYYYQSMKELTGVIKKKQEFSNTINELIILMNNKPDDPKITTLVEQLNKLTKDTVEAITKDDEYNKTQSIFKNGDTQGGYKKIKGGESEAQIGNLLIGNVFKSEIEDAEVLIGQLEGRKAFLSARDIKIAHERLNADMAGEITQMTSRIRALLQKKGFDNVDKIDLKTLMENSAAVDALKEFASKDSILMLAELIKKYDNLRERLDDIADAIIKKTIGETNKQPKKNNLSSTDYLFERTPEAGVTLNSISGKREQSNMSISLAISYYQAAYRLNTQFKDYESSGRFDVYQKQHQEELAHFTESTHEAAKPFMKGVKPKENSQEEVSINKPLFKVRLLDAFEIIREKLKMPVKNLTERVYRGFGRKTTRMTNNHVAETLVKHSDSNSSSAGPSSAGSSSNTSPSSADPRSAHPTPLNQHGIFHGSEEKDNQRRTNSIHYDPLLKEAVKDFPTLQRQVDEVFEQVTSSLRMEDGKQLLARSDLSLIFSQIVSGDNVRKLEVANSHVKDTRKSFQKLRKTIDDLENEGTLTSTQGSTILHGTLDEIQKMVAQFSKLQASQAQVNLQGAQNEVKDKNSLD